MPGYFFEGLRYKVSNIPDIEARFLSLGVPPWRSGLAPGVMAAPTVCSSVIAFKPSPTTSLNVFARRRPSRPQKSASSSSNGHSTLVAIQTEIAQRQSYLLLVDFTRLTASLLNRLLHPSGFLHSSSHSCMTWLHAMFCILSPVQRKTQRRRAQIPSIATWLPSFHDRSSS